ATVGELGVALASGIEQRLEVVVVPGVVVVERRDPLPAGLAYARVCPRDIDDSPSILAVARPRRRQRQGHEPDPPVVARREAILDPAHDPRVAVVADDYRLPALVALAAHGGERAVEQQLDPVVGRDPNRDQGLALECPLVVCGAADRPQPLSPPLLVLVR